MKSLTVTIRIITVTILLMSGLLMSGCMTTGSHVFVPVSSSKDDYIKPATEPIQPPAETPKCAQLSRWENLSRNKKNELCWKGTPVRFVKGRHKPYRQVPEPNEYILWFSATPSEYYEGIKKRVPFAEFWSSGITELRGSNKKISGRETVYERKTEIPIMHILDEPYDTPSEHGKWLVENFPDKYE